MLFEDMGANGLRMMGWLEKNRGYVCILREILPFKNAIKTEMVICKY